MGPSGARIGVVGDPEEVRDAAQGQVPGPDAQLDVGIPGVLYGACPELAPSRRAPADVIQE